MTISSRRIVPIIAAGHVVLGRKLHILGADHLEILEAANVGLVNGEIPTPRDLLNCVAILSQTPEEAAADFERGSRWKIFGNKGWFRFIRRRIWGRRIKEILRGEALYEKEAIKLAGWLNDNWKPPKIRWKSSKNKSSTSPYTDHLRLLLCEKGIVSSMDEAGRYPISDAAWEAEAVHESVTGESRLESESDRRAEDLLDLSEKRAREEAANG